MELHTAKEIVKGLVDGINPATGEVLPQESPYNDPGIIRALLTLLQQLQTTKTAGKTLEEKQQINLDNGKPQNAGLAWTDASRSELAADFSAGADPKALALQFGRTRGAVVSELERQGLIERKAPQYAEGKPT